MRLRACVSECSDSFGLFILFGLFGLFGLLGLFGLFGLFGMFGLLLGVCGGGLIFWNVYRIHNHFFSGGISIVVWCWTALVWYPNFFVNWL